MKIGKKMAMKINLTRKLQFFGVFFVLSCLGACSPGLKESISVPGIADPQAVLATEMLAPVRVGEVRDVRDAAWLVKIDGRAVQGEGNITGNVRLGLEDALKREGFRPTLFDGALIEVRLVEWQGVVTPDFPVGRVSAEAGVELDVLSGQDDGGFLYRGIYEGSALLEHPVLTEDHIRNTLRQAMQEALRAAAKDTALRDALRMG